MEELDIAAVTRRTIHGVVALITRSLFINVIAFAVFIILPFYFSPAIFGVYAIVSSVIAFLTYFSDIGLAAALIQKKDAITQDDLKTTFTIQQLLVVTMVVIGLLASSFVGRFYHLQQNGILLFQALAISFFLSSLKTIPSILMERELHFEKLVIPQVVENLFFFITLLICAMMGLGVTSYTYAVLLRGITGLIATYVIRPWKMEIGFSKEAAKHLLSFGIPFQTNSLLALVKDDLLIAYIGKVLPLAQLGYITFAQKWAFTPLRLIMDNVIRITFPSFSRLQNEENHLAKGIEKSLFALTFLIFPSLIGLVMLIPQAMALIPKYHRYEPAILSLGFFAINAGLSSISTPLTNALNAIGKIKISLYLMIFWTIATWVLTPICIWKFGFNGVAIASALIATSVIGVVIIVKRIIPFSLSPVIFPPVIASGIMTLVLTGSIAILPKTWETIFVLILLGVVSYMGSIFLIARKQVFADIAIIQKQFVKS